jgi:hypothetical protein
MLHLEMALELLNNAPSRPPEKQESRVHYVDLLQQPQLAPLSDIELRVLDLEMADINLNPFKSKDE